ncbi:Ankyrin repeat protein [Legionella busanensis]|uniref:Ankyrin repeat protein n=1 Tax=Legionella busanensis TaxID=190655 RepID=A0A378JQA9_9GAMM|nr:ankyrin repeat domain-containing protein [Legionella busanensis]STX52359.1 Ankyrin repeat protein [Legionella busanensis]
MALERVCIVGSGPAGLTTLINLVEEAKKNPHKEFYIDIIDVRGLEKEYLTRRQKLIVFAADKASGLDSDVRWDDFCRQVFDPENKLDQSSKRKRFIDKLARQPEILSQHVYKNFSIKDLQAAFLEQLTQLQLPDNIKIVWRPNTKIDEIDIQKNIVHTTEYNQKVDIKPVTFNLESPKEFSQKAEDPFIQFDTLVICEGSQRETTKLVNAAIQTYNENKESTIKPFTYNLFAIQPSPFHCAVRLKLKDLKDIENGKYATYGDFFEDKQFSLETITVDSIKHLGEMGWEFGNTRLIPDSVVDSNSDLYESDDVDKIPRFFVASEIPESIYNIDNELTKRQKIIKWAKQLAAIKYKIPQKYFEFDPKGESAKNRLNATTFSMTMDYVDSPVRRLPGGSHVVTVGDCSMSSVYVYGASSTLALHQSIKLAPCITNVDHITEPKERFKPLIRAYNLHRESVKKFLRGMYIKKDKAKQKQNLFDEKERELSDKLSDAVINRDLQVVQSLLNSGANYNRLNSAGSTPFELAIQHNKVDIVEEFLFKGANPNKKMGSHNPLTIAIGNRNSNLVKILLDYGANPDSFVSELSPLALALKTNQPEIIQLLIEHGANIDIAIKLLDENDELLTKIIDESFFEIAKLDINRNDYASLIDISGSIHVSPYSYEDNFLYEFYDSFPFNAKKSTVFESLIHPGMARTNPELVLLCYMWAYDNALKNGKMSENEKLNCEQRRKELLDKFHAICESSEAKNKYFQEFYQESGAIYLDMLEASVMYAPEKFANSFFKITPEMIETSKKEMDTYSGNFYDKGVRHFVTGMVNKLAKYDEKTYLENMQMAVNLEYIPAMLELGKHLLQQGDVESAFNLFVQAASKKSAFAFIELASLLADYPIGHLSLYNASVYLSKGNERSNSYYLNFHDNAYDKLDELKKKLEIQKESTDIFVRINASLDLALEREYDKRVHIYMGFSDNQTQKMRLNLDLALRQFSKQFISIMESELTDHDKLQSIHSLISTLLLKNISPELRQELVQLNKDVKQNFTDSYKKALSERYKPEQTEIKMQGYHSG